MDSLRNGKRSSIDGRSHWPRNAIRGQFPDVVIYLGHQDDDPKQHVIILLFANRNDYQSFLQGLEA